MNKKASTIIIIMACVAVIAGVKFYKQHNSGILKESKIIRAKGNPDAPVKIVEFIDFQCPACAMGSRYLRDKIQEYPDKIYLELKYFPLGMHQHAFISAQYVECSARQGKLWLFHDKVMDRQNSWKNLIDPKPAFDIMAKELGMNLDELGECLEDESVRNFILDNKDQGNSLGVKSTPTYFVNDKLLVGAKSLDIEIKRLLGIEPGN